MSEQEAKRLAEAIAAAVAVALGTGTDTGTPEKPKTKRKGKHASGGLVLERKGTKFTFTLVQAGIRGGTKDKYSVRIERDGQAHTRGAKTPAGVSVSEHFTAPRLDFLTGITKKYFVQA